MIVYVAAGGMLATSWVQIIKAVLMLGAGAIVLFLALAGVGFDPLTFFASAEAKAGPNFLLPGNLLKNPFDEVSLGLGYMLGLAGLPHVMTRFYTCRTRQPRDVQSFGSCFWPAPSLPVRRSSALRRSIILGRRLCAWAIRAAT